MESKIELTERLRREGRWEEASKRKDEMVKLLRAEGMKRTEAVEEAWRRLAVEYPPLPHTAEPEPEHGDDEAEEKAAGRVVGPTTLPAAWGDLPESAPFEVEVEWVHQNRVLVVEERTGGAVPASLGASPQAGPKLRGGEPDGVCRDESQRASWTSFSG